MSGGDLPKILYRFEKVVGISGLTGSRGEEGEITDGIRWRMKWDDEFLKFPEWKIFTTPVSVKSSSDWLSEKYDQCSVW